MDYEKRCDNCYFKYCEAYEEQVYSCMFGLERCKLTEFEKKKIQCLENQIEDVCDELYKEEYNGTITKEKEKELIEKQNALCKERNEYLNELKKKGKIFYE